MRETYSGLITLQQFERLQTVRDTFRYCNAGGCEGAVQKSAMVGIRLTQVTSMGRGNLGESYSQTTI